MRTMILSCLLLAGASRLLAEEPKIRLADLEGVTHEVPEPKKPTVVVFITPDCPISNSYAPEINRIVEAYSAKGIGFFLVHADPAVKAEEAKKHAHDYGFRCPVLLDAQKQLIRRAQATVTPEVAVFSAEGKLVYHGRIDDTYVSFGKRRDQPTTRDLREALDAILEGKSVPHATSEPVGCFIPK